MSTKKVIEFRVKDGGDFTLQAKEGFVGTNCREETRNLELVLNGEAVSTKNTSAYYDGDGGDININLDRN